MNMHIPLYIAWGQAVVATVGSLIFSELYLFPPCVLCWYQRICIYPLVVIFTVGIIKKDTGVVWYVVPLAAFGWIIALYHSLLYYNILPQSVAPCEAGISCTTKFIEWFGFVTIPMLSLVAFTVILGCMGWYWRIITKEKGQ